jgi:c(7)-type cytochrome triheme protein
MSTAARKLILTLALSLLIVASADAAQVVYFRFKSAEPVPFSHDFHLQKYNKNCKICHVSIFRLDKRQRTTMAEMEKGKSCGACHNGVKAFSVAEERFCKKCHSGRPGNVVFALKKSGDATFSHPIHLEKLGNACRTCHNGKVMTGKRGVTMATMEKGASCGTCHDGSSAFTVAGNCDRCHKGFKPATITFKTDAGDASFSHDIHLGMFKCADCHTGTFPFKAGVVKTTMAEMEKGKSCGACHDGSTAFSVKADCDKCHKM